MNATLTEGCPSGQREQTVNLPADAFGGSNPPRPTVTSHQISVRRVYDRPDAGEGWRVLVDRLWPRGVRKDGAPVDEWLKAAAPSDELRRWYGHSPDRFDEFARRYRAELGQASTRAAVDHLLDRARSGSITLVTATRDVERSGATVLADHLRRRLR